MYHFFDDCLERLEAVSTGEVSCFWLHGGSLRGPPIPPASGRRQYEGIKNGGLDFFKAAAGGIYGMVIVCWATAFFFCRRPAEKSFSIQSPVFPPVHPGTYKQTLLLYLCRPRKTVRCTPYPIPHPP